MANRLTDKQKKKILADYLEMGSYNAVAKKHKISDNTVKRVVLNSEGFAEKVEQKKQQNTADILEHMEQKKGIVCEIIDKYLVALLDDERIAKATPQQLTTALGTVIDKFTANANPKQEIHPLILDLVKAKEEKDK